MTKFSVSCYLLFLNIFRLGMRVCFSPHGSRSCQPPRYARLLTAEKQGYGGRGTRVRRPPYGLYDGRRMRVGQPPYLHPRAAIALIF